METQEILLNANQPEFPDRLRTKAWVRQLLGVSQTTFWRLEKSGRFVRPVGILGSERYLESEVLDWLRTRGGESEATR